MGRSINEMGGRSRFLITNVGVILLRFNYGFIERACLPDLIYADNIVEVE